MPRLLRSEAHARGICSGCRKNRARDGLKTCSGCAAREERTYHRQIHWRECCQSSDVHRFDCPVYEGKRGKGPFGPTKEPTAAELVAALRRVA